MKQVCRKWWEAVLAFLQRNPGLAKMLFFSLSLGFIIMTIGVALNLARSESILKFFKP